MSEYLLKLFLSATIIVIVSEVAKRSGFWGGVIASLPLTSILAITWLYMDTGDTAKISSLSTNIFWMVLPSLSLFIVLPLALKYWSFWPSFGLALLSCGGAYLLTIQLISYWSIKP